MIAQETDIVGQRTQFDLVHPAWVGVCRPGQPGGERAQPDQQVEEAYRTYGQYGLCGAVASDQSHTQGLPPRPRRGAWVTPHRLLLPPVGPSEASSVPPGSKGAADADAGIVEALGIVAQPRIRRMVDDARRAAPAGCP